MLLSGLIVLSHLWRKVVPRKDLTAVHVLKRLITASGVFVITFLITYTSIFYIHLSMLTNAGPHDSVMTSAFQASLNVKLIYRLLIYFLTKLYTMISISGWIGEHCKRTAVGSCTWVASDAATCTWTTLLASFSSAQLSN